MFPRDTDKQRECIYREQVKTNELLEKLIESLSNPELPKTTVKEPINTTPRNATGKQKPRGKAV